MSKETDIANILADNIGHHPFKSASGIPLFFDEYALAKQYAELFNIVSNEDLSKFKSAFKIVTEGQGGEISKINSLISSALLPLLVFFRLFENASNHSIKLALPGFEEKIIFDKCFYEVRNEVIKLPSCVDVVLYSSTQKVMLFLESKFTEIYSINDVEKYGKGYIELYKNPKIIDALGLSIKVDNTDKKNLILTSQSPCYIEGIKQTISHLIGLVRGPKSYPKGKYPIGYSQEYFKSYKEAFDNSTVLYYGTIIFDTSSMGISCDGLDNYKNLYQDIIGEHGVSIIAAIKEWDIANGNKCKHDKDIRVLKEPITYQSIFGYENNIELLNRLNKVKSFYQLN